MNMHFILIILYTIRVAPTTIFDIFEVVVVRKTGVIAHF